jgi:glycosyltransferase involved in cell wall biosynthesis
MPLKSKNKKKLLMILNVDYFLVSHRLDVAIEAQRAGYEVHIAAKQTSSSKIIKSKGLFMHDLKIDRASTNVIDLIKTYFDILRILRKTNPDIVHLISIKPILIGGLALHFFKSNPLIVSSVSGLGYIFTNRGIISFFRRTIISLIYRISLSHENIKVIFQNKNDLNFISKIAKIRKKNSFLINGSGVDLKKFNFSNLPKNESIILFPARLVKNKGLREFIYAAEILRGSGRFVISGMKDKESPDKISNKFLQSFIDNGTIEYWGYCKNMPEILKQSTLVVLPSYREGLPKVLCEASAIGRPIITTDVPGCRDSIIENKTGLLIPARNSKILAKEIKNLLLDRNKMEYFGYNGRILAKEKFNIKAIVAEHLKIYNNTKK